LFALVPSFSFKDKNTLGFIYSLYLANKESASLTKNEDSFINLSIPSVCTVNQITPLEVEVMLDGVLLDLNIKTQTALIKDLQSQYLSELMFKNSESLLKLANEKGI
jgi:hypothetical protein